MKIYILVMFLVSYIIYSELSKKESLGKEVCLMFKKIAGLALAFACCFSIMASATFLDSNTRFVQVGHDDTTESYLDLNTIQSVRYDPPYYIIRATVITYDYAHNTVQGYDNNFFYNFKAQTVKTQTLGDVGYDLQGNVVSTLALPNPEVKTTDRLSANGNAANRAFRACYDMNFFQE